MFSPQFLSSAISLRSDAMPLFELSISKHSAGKAVRTMEIAFGFLLFAALGATPLAASAKTTKPATGAATPATGATSTKAAPAPTSKAAAAPAAGAGYFPHRNRDTLYDRTGCVDPAGLQTTPAPSRHPRLRRRPAPHPSESLLRSSFQRHLLLRNKPALRLQPACRRSLP